jgi:hypothetical protein
VRREEIRALLGGGDRRSLGRSGEAVALVLEAPERFGELIGFLYDSDPLIRMRAADAAEKASRHAAALLEPYKAELLGLLGEAVQAEVRWHLALMIPRLRLTARERGLAIEVLERYLQDRSSIVKTCAMQGLFELRETDLVRWAARNGTPAMRARGRKLLRDV